MAVVNAYANLNTYDPSVWYGDLYESDSSHIVISDGYNTAVYEGYGFAYSGYDVVGGTLTSYSEYAGGSLLGEVYDFAISASLASDYISRNDLHSFFEIALAGHDELYGSTGADRIATYNGNDLIYANGGDDLVLSGGGHDTIYLHRSGNIALDGGDGFDWAVLSGRGANYTYVDLNVGIELYSNATGIDVAMQNVERVAFDDGVLAFDLSGKAGQAYRIYQAAFDREPDVSGLGYWIEAMDDGVAMRSVAQGFLASAEFSSVYGANVSNDQFIDRLYENVLGRAGELSGITFWVNELDTGARDRASVLAGFSESPENIALVAPAISDGIWYT